MSISTDWGGQMMSDPASSTYSVDVFLMLCSTQHYTSLDNPNQDTFPKDFFSFRQMEQTRPATIQQYIQ